MRQTLVRKVARGISVPEINFQGISQNLRHGRSPRLMHLDLDLNLDSWPELPFGSGTMSGPGKGPCLRDDWEQETGLLSPPYVYMARGAARIRAMLTFSSMMTAAQSKLYFQVICGPHCFEELHLKDEVSDSAQTILLFESQNARISPVSKKTPQSGFSPCPLHSSLQLKPCSISA